MISSCWPNVGPPSATLAPQKPSIGFRLCLVLMVRIAPCYRITSSGFDQTSIIFTLKSSTKLQNPRGNVITFIFDETSHHHVCRQ